MKLKDLKQWVNMLPEAELEKELMYNCMDYGISGSINEITRSDENLYYAGDQPVVLHTRNELNQIGYAQSDIDAMEIEIPEGCYYVELSNEYSILERFL